MKQLPSVRFAAQSPEEIIAFLDKSAAGVSSEKIVQGIALATLDGKRPDNSGTLRKYIRAKCNAEIAGHAFSVAVAFAALNGVGLGHVEEDKFIVVPLNWHLDASAIVNLVAKPEAKLDDAARAGVHEEIAEIYRTKPEKGGDLLKLIKARFKAPKGEKTDGEGDGEEAVEEAPDAKLVRLATAISELMSLGGLKAFGAACDESTDLPTLQRVEALLGTVDLDKVVLAFPLVRDCVTARIATITPAEAPAAAETPAESAPVEAAAA